MFKMFLIKYAEIAIKGKNRYLFEDALVEQIRHTLERVEGHFVVTKNPVVCMCPVNRILILMKWWRH